LIAARGIAWELYAQWRFRGVSPRTSFYLGFPPPLIFPSVFEGFMEACALEAAERERDVLSYMEAKSEAEREHKRGGR